MIDLTQKCNLIQGDCLEKLKELPDESIDLVLTDPPYSLTSIVKRFGKEGSAEAKEGTDGSFKRLSGGFMGKKWDSEFPKVEIWKELLRVMKSGSFCVFTMTPRQDSLLNCLINLDKAGFNLGFSSMFWLYHSGFPKASDISKVIMKQEGDEGKIIGKKNYSSPKADNSISKNSYGISGGSLKNGVVAERIVLNEIEPTSDLAKQWFGFKSFSLKPAVEVIIVVQKPRTEKTIVGQVLSNGCGAVNVEECRIPFAEGGESIPRGTIPYEMKANNNFGGGNDNRQGTITLTSMSGRFPANLIVQDNALVSESDGAFAPVKSGQKGFGGEIYGKYASSGDDGKTFYSDKETDKSANRFYDLDRWAEKHNITLTEDSAFFDVPKPSKEETNIPFWKISKQDSKSKFYDLYLNAIKQFGENAEWIETNKIKGYENVFVNQNTHPTKKPVKLFSYLSKLFCQPKGLILDPFMGSGTTGLACFEMGFNFIGIEKEKEYFDIAEARLKKIKTQKRLFE